MAAYRIDLRYVVPLLVNLFLHFTGASLWDYKGSLVVASVVPVFTSSRLSSTVSSEPIRISFKHFSATILTLFICSSFLSPEYILFYVYPIMIPLSYYSGRFKHLLHGLLSFIYRVSMIVWFQVERLSPEQAPNDNSAATRFQPATFQENLGSEHVIDIEEDSRY